MSKETKKRMMVHRTVSFAIIALACCFVQFHRNTTGVIKGDLTEAFAMSATSFGTLSAVYFYPYMLVQLPIGVLLDMFGTRKTVSLGCLIAAAGSLIFGNAQSFGIACLGRALIGIGVSAPVVSMQKLISSWFRENRQASAFSTSSMIGYCGALLAQYPLAWLIKLVSWRIVFVICMGISIILAVLCWLFVRDTPEQCGLPSMADLDGRVVVRQSRLTLQATLRAIGRMFKNKYVWPLIVIMMIHQGLQALFSATWAVPYLCDVYGMTSLEAAGFTSAMMVGMVLFGFLSGKVSDRIGSRKIVLSFISGFMALLWFVFAFGPDRFMSTPMLWAAMFLMGISGSGIQIMFSYSREVNDPAFVGVSVTAVNFTGMIASASMPTLCGVVLDKFALQHAGAALYQRAFTVCVVLAVIAFVLSLCLRETGCRNRYYEFVAPEKRPQTDSAGHAGVEP